MGFYSSVIKFLVKRRHGRCQDVSQIIWNPKHWTKWSFALKSTSLCCQSTSSPPPFSSQLTPADWYI